MSCRCAARARVGDGNKAIDVTDSHNHGMILSRRLHKAAKHLLEIRRNKRHQNNTI